MDEEAMEKRRERERERERERLKGKKTVKERKVEERKKMSVVLSLG